VIAGAACAGPADARALAAFGSFAAFVGLRAFAVFGAFAAAAAFGAFATFAAFAGVPPSIARAMSPADRFLRLMRRPS
jgi:hypothetical protein